MFGFVIRIYHDSRSSECQTGIRDFKYYIIHHTVRDKWHNVQNYKPVVIKCYVIGEILEKIIFLRWVVIFLYKINTL